MTAENQDRGHVPATVVTVEDVNAPDQDHDHPLRGGRLHTRGNATNYTKKINGDKKDI